MTTPFPFVSGAVLTAAQLNAITEVPVSAKTASYTLAATDAGSRITMSSASATTITVNTGLFTAGQSLRIQNIGAGACTITAGTATVTSAGPLALVQWAGGQLFFTSASAAVWFPDAVTATSAALVLVKSQAIGTTVSSVAVTSAFDATYETYKIVISGTTSSSTSDALNLQLGSTTTGYYSASVGAYYDSASGSTNVRQSNNGSNFKFAGGITNNFVSLNIDIVNPQVAEITTIGAFVPYYNSAYETSGYLNDSTQYTGFTIIPATGTITGGTIYVYGYAKA